MMLTVPAAVRQQLRTALYSQLGRTGENLPAAHRESARAEEWTDPLARLERFRALLDQLGWHTRDPEVDVSIDVARHRWALTAALRAELEDEDYIMEDEEGHSAQARSEARARVLLLESFAAGLDLDAAEQIITIPAGFVDLTSTST